MMYPKFETTFEAVNSWPSDAQPESIVRLILKGKTVDGVADLCRLTPKQVKDSVRFELSRARQKQAAFVRLAEYLEAMIERFDDDDDENDTW